MKSNTLATLLCLALTGAGSVLAQTATTDPVGFVSVTVPANSDAVLSVPLNRTAEFKGMIQTISGNTITMAGTNPAWATAPQKWVFAEGTQNKTYAVQIASGTKEGMIAKIVSNTANSVTIQLEAGDSLTGVVPEDADAVANNGDQIDIMPYWTPASLITSTVAQGSQILLLESALAGVNLSSSGSYGYDSGGWVDEGTFGSADHSPLTFGHAFIFRNGGAANTFSIVGSVPMNKHRVLLRVPSGSSSQDLAIGFSSPIPTAVGSIGLNFTEDDQLLVFPNATPGQNKSASEVLYYTSADGWIDGSFQPVGTTFLLQPGQGYIFRKKSTGSPTTLVWTALQPYLQ
jgi:uncharacterized protein (TIGR02597 family)